MSFNMLSPNQKRFAKGNFSDELQRKLKNFGKNIKYLDKDKLKNRAQIAFFGPNDKKIPQTIDESIFLKEDFSSEEFCNKLFAKYNWQNINQDFISKLEEKKKKRDESLQTLVYENYKTFIATSKLIESFLEADIVKLSDVLNELKKAFRTIYHLEFEDIIQNERDEGKNVIEKEQDKYIREFGSSQLRLESDVGFGSSGSVYDLTGLETPIFSPDNPFQNDTTFLTNSQDQININSDSGNKHSDFKFLSDGRIYDEELDSIEAKIWDKLLDLDSALGMREFETAVGLVSEIYEKIKAVEEKKGEHSEYSGKKRRGKTNQAKQELVVTSIATKAERKYLTLHKKELEIRAQKLHEELIHELHNPLLQKNNCYTFVRCLKELTSPKIARHNFLKAKSYLIRERIRNIILQGDILLYVQKVASILFQCILSTGKEFKNLFNETKDVSAFTQWILKELSHFAQLFKNQVFSSLSFTNISECTRVVFEQCHLLEEAGISVTFRLEQLLKEDLSTSVTELKQRIEQDYKRVLDHETWTLTEYQSPVLTDSEGAILTFKLTDSCRLFFQQIIQMCLDIERIQTESIYDSFVASISDLLEDYTGNMAATCAIREQINDQRFLAIISNAYHIKKILLPWIVERFSEHFKRSIPKLTNLSDSIERFDSTLCLAFASSRAEMFLDRYIHWNSAKYPPQETKLSENVSLSFRKFFEFLVDIHSKIERILPKKYSKIIPLLAKRLIILMNDKDSFFRRRLQFLIKSEDTNSDDKSRVEDLDWKYTDIMGNQVILDVNFFQTVAVIAGLATEKFNEEVQELLSFLTESFKKLKLDLQDESWIQERIQMTLSENTQLQHALEKLREIS